MRGGTKVLASTLLLGGLAAALVFHPLSPSLPRPGIDPSWVAALGEAADRPARWGVDLAFTYGPASPLVTGYRNGAWLTRTVPLQLAFALLFGWCGALLAVTRAAAPGRPPPGLGWLPATGLFALALVAARGAPDALFLTLPFLAFLASRLPGGAAAAASALTALALGLTAMAKMSFPLAALPVFALGDALLLRARRPPRLLAPFALGAAAGLPLYGQRLSDLPSYLRLQGEVVAGYAGAMAVDGPAWDLAAFLLLAAALAAPLARRGRRAAGLGFAVAVLFLVKAGFVRHDLHSMLAWSGLALLGAALAARVLPRRAALAAAGAVAFVALAYEPVVTVRQSVRDGRGAALARVYAGMAEAPAAEAAAAWAALRDPGAFRARLDGERAAAWAAVRRAQPLRPLAGTADVIPSMQSAALAAGLAYAPRPSFQEYSTYTAGLLAANRAYLEGPRAPRWILFGPEQAPGYMALDGRFPSLAEGALWPDLLRLYRPDHRDGDLVALERRPAPAPLPLGPARTVGIALGAFAPVGQGGPVWATMDAPLNLAGRVLSALFRPPLLTLAVRLDDGAVRRFRLVPALAAAGFLLSPLVDNAADYEALSAGRPAGAGRRVAAVAVEASAAGRLFYAPDAALTLRGLDVSALGAGPPPPASVAAALGAPRVAAPGALALPVGGLPDEGGARRVALGYGLDAGAGRGACFAARPADGTGSTLWSACLDASAAGAPPEEVALAVPDGVEELSLEVRCGGEACPAYWTAAGSAPR